MGLEPGEIAIGEPGVGLSSGLGDPSGVAASSDYPAQHGRESREDEDLGSEESDEDMPELEPIEGQPPESVTGMLLGQLGWVGWMVFSVSFLVGFLSLLRLLLVSVWLLVVEIGSVSEGEGPWVLVGWVFEGEGPGLGVTFVGGAWLLSTLHRLGVILQGGLGVQDHVYIEIDHPPWIATIPLGMSPERWGWVVLVILLGFAHPNEAVVQGEELAGFEVVVRDPGSSILVPTSENVCVAGEGLVDEGYPRVLMEVLKMSCLISTWEILKWVRRRRVVQRRTAASQTMEGGCIPLPLPEGIPNQAEVMFSLWRAGFNITAEPYSEAVQSRFYDYVGGYLRDQHRDEGLSD